MWRKWGTPHGNLPQWIDSARAVSDVCSQDYVLQCTFSSCALCVAMLSRRLQIIQVSTSEGGSKPLGFSAISSAVFRSLRDVGIPPQ